MKKNPSEREHKRGTAGVDPQKGNAPDDILPEYDFRGGIRGKYAKRYVGVTNVTADGLSLLVNRRELFLAFRQFPWFEDASIREIMNVELYPTDHLRWPELDVDLTIESIEHPERYPLVSRELAARVRERRDS